MSKVPDKLPVTLADVGPGALWSIEFNCLTCGYFAGPATYYLIERWGEDFPLTSVLRLLRCERCSRVRRAHECMIVVEPEAARGSATYGDHRFALRKGHDWEPYRGRWGERK